MTSSPPPDDASGQSRRRRAARPPEPADSSWADVVGLRGTWQEEGSDQEPVEPEHPARSDRRTSRREQAAADAQADADTSSPGTPAAVNPNRPWWAGAGGDPGEPSPVSSPFQPGSAMVGGSVPEPGPIGSSQLSSMFEPAGPDRATRRDGRPAAYQPPPYEPPPYEPPAAEAPEPGSAVTERPDYQAAPYDPSGYQSPSRPSSDRPVYTPPPYEPPSYPTPTYPPAAYPPAAYPPAAYPETGYQPPTYEQKAPESKSFDFPVYEPPAYERSAQAPENLDPPRREPGYTPPPLERPTFDLPATWNPPTSGLTSLDELTSTLPAIPAAPIPAAPVVKKPAEAVIAPPTATPPMDDAPTSVGLPPVLPATAPGGAESSFNSMLTGAIPMPGKGPRTRGSGSRARSPEPRNSEPRNSEPRDFEPRSPEQKSPEQKSPAPKSPAPSSPSPKSPAPKSPAPKDAGDDTTIFPAGLTPSAPDEPAEADDFATRTMRRVLPEAERRPARDDRDAPSRPARPERPSQPAQPDRRAADDDHEGPLNQPQNMLLPGVPGPAPSAGRAGRNLPAAIGVGVGLGALAVVSLFTRPEAFVAVVSVVAVLAVWELAGAMAAKDIMVPVVPLAVGSLGMLVSAFVAGEEGLLVSFTLTGFGVLLWRIIDGVEGAARDITAGLFVAAYVPLLAAFAILMLADGPKYVVAFILVTVASDIGGYAAGVLAGKHPMAPTISPKKTWEGFGGSVLACLVVGTVSVVVLLDGPPLAGLALGAAAVVTATLGDLAESLLKRDLNVKDMGNLLPGHGGLMDRLDSLLPTAPVAFLILHTLVATR